MVIGCCKSCTHNGTQPLGVDRNRTFNPRPRLLPWGLPQPGAPPLSAAGGATAGSDADPRGRHRDRQRVSVAPAGVPPYPPLGSVTLKMALRQPVWLLRRKSRVVHVTGPGSEVEADAASRPSTCVFPTHSDRQARKKASAQLGALTAAPSQSYRRDLFRRDPPTDPAADSDLFLVVLVVVPASAAVVLLLLERRYQPRQPPRRSRGRLLAVAMAGGGGCGAAGLRWVRGPAGASRPRVASCDGARRESVSPPGQ